MSSVILRHYETPRARGAWLAALLAAGANACLLFVLAWLQRGGAHEARHIELRPAVLRSVITPKPVVRPKPHDAPRPKSKPKPMRLERPAPKLERPHPTFSPMQRLLLKASLAPLKIETELDVPVQVPPKDAKFDTAAPAARPLRLLYGYGEVDEPPRQIRRCRPRYPTAAERRRLQGYVRIAFVVDAQGRVGKIEVIEAKPPGVFDEAAIQAARRWRFTPGKVEGRPVQTRCAVTIRFQLTQ